MPERACDHPAVEHPVAAAAVVVVVVAAAVVVAEAAAVVAAATTTTSLTTSQSTGCDHDSGQDLTFVRPPELRAHW
jgi:hypothetical protein